MSSNFLSWPSGIPAQEAEAIRTACHHAWQRSLLAGFNGNVSMRTGPKGDLCLVTRSGAAKGALQRDDLCLVRLADGQTITGGPPSSELGMHLAIYRTQPKAQAIVHTHPPHLLALSLRLPPQQRLQLAVFEAAPLRERMTTAPDHEPGTQVLADAVGRCAKTHEAVWMERHGLVAWGKDLVIAGALNEELEHLARIQLFAGGAIPVLPALPVVS